MVNAAGGMRLALGLMSGTSCDGVDAALVETDGRQRVRCGAAATYPYTLEFHDRLRSIMGGRAPVGEIERELTMLHADAVKALLRQSGTDESQVVAIGFHGQTILHEPDQGRTWQIGDGALLARQTGIDVVNDFRSRDIAEGGQGAPLVPLFHAALAAGLPRPIAVLNIGGVANVTWIGNGSEELLAFDTGPGNALLNDWVQRHLGVPIDRDGALARAGRVWPEVVARFMSHAYFDRPAPKSLDRDAFDSAPIAALSPADGAATLTAFTVAAVARAAGLFPSPVKRWLVTGGGRHNPAMMAGLSAALEAPVAPVESVGWNGDALEAQAFAYLAVRSLDGLPLSLPGTTGAKRPISGGRLHRRP